MCFRCAEKSLLFTLSDSLLFLTVGHMVFVIHCNVFFKGRHTFGLIIIRVSIGSFLFEIWPPFSFWPVSHLYQLKRCSSSSYNSRNEKRIKRWQITFPSFQHRLRRFLSKTVSLSPLSWKKGAHYLTKERSMQRSWRRYHLSIFIIVYVWLSLAFQSSIRK